MINFKEKEERKQYKNRTLGMNFNDFKKIEENRKKYLYERNFGNESTGLSIFEKSNNKIDVNKNTCYNSSKEGKDMSFMMMYFDEENVYIASDSRVTFENEKYEDNFKKIYVNDDKDKIIASTGLATKVCNNEIINFIQEISELYFSGLNIIDALNTKRISDNTYLDIIGNNTIHFFVAEKYKMPIIIDITNTEIIIKIPRNKYTVYSNGDYDTDVANNEFVKKMNQGYFPEDAMEEIIKDIIEETNKNKISTIGGEIQIEIV